MLWAACYHVKYAGSCAQASQCGWLAGEKCANPANTGDSCGLQTCYGHPMLNAANHVSSLTEDKLPEQMKPP